MPGKGWGIAAGLLVLACSGHDDPVVSAFLDAGRAPITAAAPAPPGARARHPDVPAQFVDPAERVSFIRAAMDAAEPAYFARGEDGAWQLPNPAHGFVAGVHGSTIGLVMNAGTRALQGPWRPAGAQQDARIELTLLAIGRGDASVPVAAVSATTAVRNRVTLERGDVHEWYESGRLGLEQGFTLDHAPHGEGALVLEIGVAGDATPENGADGVKLVHGGRVVARVGEVFAKDARGDVREGTITAGDGVLRLSVDVRGVQWPLEVDPNYWLERPSLVEPGFPSPGLGTSVAMDGDTLIAGAPGDGVDVAPWTPTGAVYVYTRSGTTWTQQSKLLASDGSGGDQFGTAVALQGDTALVTADSDDLGRGSFYAFARTGTTWTQRWKAQASDGGNYEYFGRSIAISGNSAVVGAIRKASTGALYVFTQSGTAWTEQAELLASDGANNDYLGGSVAHVADVVVGGAVADDAWRGSAYVFARTGTTWVQQAKLTASDGVSSDYFGYSLSLSGVTVAIGAPARDQGLNLDVGASYLFARSGTTWSQQQILVASNSAQDAFFGQAVAMGATRLLVGARPESYVFALSGTTWSEQQRGLPGASSVALSGSTGAMGRAALNDNGGEVDTIVDNAGAWSTQSAFQGPNGTSTDQFGTSSLAVTDTDAIVGACGDQSERGAAFFFARSGADWSGPVQVVASDGVAGDRFGWSSAISSATAVIGAELDDAQRGSAYIFVRSGTSWAQQAKLQASDGVANDRFGTAVAIDGETALVGAWPTSAAGSAYVFVRAGTTWSQQAKVVPPSSQIGASVALSGDTALVGARGDNSYRGAGFVYLRTGTTWAQQAKLSDAALPAFAYLGVSASLSGDTAVLGANGTASGEAYVFARTGTTWAQQQKLTVSGSAYLGNTVAVAGDTAVPSNASDHVFTRVGSTWSDYQNVVRGGPLVALSPANLLIGNSNVVYPFILSPPLANGASCPGGAFTCASASCRDGFCCDQPCTGACQRCDATPGTCTAVVNTTDADTCFGGQSCDAAGLCKKINGQGCALGSDCLSGFCADGYCCNAACTGGCDVCNAPAGSCSTIASGSTGATPSCAPYLCSGASGACPSTCASDSNCASGFYCNASGSCVSQKVTTLACDTTAGADCKVAGCRVCQSGNCVDDFCCSSACSAQCDSCAASLKASGSGDGNCGISADGYPGGPTCATYACNGLQTNCATGCNKDAQCQPGFYCTAAGTCVAQRPTGSACAYTSDCFGGLSCRECSSGNCADGYCCNTACSGPCDVCAASLGATSNGTCGSAPASYAGNPSCDPYRCSGVGAGCGATCGSDAQCAPGGFCNTTLGQCQPDQADGASCSGSSQCSSGNCVDGVCCNSACSGTCVACSALLKASGTGDGLCDVVKSGSDPHGTCAASATACAEDGLCNGAGVCRLALAGTSCGSTVCVGNAVSGQVCDGGGSCTTSGGTPCSPYQCATGACTNPCAGDSQCLNGYFCDLGTCRAKQPNGQACAGTSACQSSNCVDGVCCDGPCGGACDACSVADGAQVDGTCAPIAPGSSGSPACGSYLCDGTSSACPPTCSADADCAAGAYCNASAHCVLRKAQGAACDVAAGNDCLIPGCRACSTNNCVDGFCCDSACNGACNTCGQTPGTCTLVPAGGAGNPSCAPDVCPGTGPSCNDGCNNDAECSAAGWCDGSACQSDQVNGGACDRTAQCQSGFCVDGVCCNAACSGLCQACSALEKGGGANGACGSAASGKDPHGSCSADASATCQQDGQCDGNAACRLYQLGVACGATVCASNLVTGQICNGAGTCSAVAGGTACDPYRCSGGACSNPCVGDSDCSPGNWCDTGTCTPKRSSGAFCTGGNACQSTFCSDGVCCDGPCNGACNACGVASGATVDGTCATVVAGTSVAACGSYVCDGTSATCPGSCSGDAQCSAGAYCDASGHCAPEKGQAQGCNAAAGADCLVTGCGVCATGFCVDGYCCDTQCSGACDGCSATPGTCSVSPASAPGVPPCAPNACDGSSATCGTTCANDNQCAPSGYCTSGGQCAADEPTGQACTRTEQCQSGFCVDGVCCNSACTGRCQACAAGLKQSGTADGTCDSAQDGVDPHADCAAYAPSSCQQDGQCDGVGRCRLYTPGTSCGAGNTCIGNLVKGQICDGLGTCATESNGQDCAPYVCRINGCVNPCALDGDCTTGNFCDLGTCAPGQACTVATSCASGFCVDAVCCDGPCTACQACTAAKKQSATGDGSCGPAQAGTDSNDFCPDDGAPSCDRDGTCDGAGQCRGYGSSASCGSAQCTGDATSGYQVTGYQCDGAGTCVVGLLQSCGEAGCNGSACLTSCTDDTDCAAAAYCAGNVCTSRRSNGASCTAAHECVSDYCVDGVCCDGLCAGQCEACNVASSVGKCAAVIGAPLAGRPVCAAASASDACSATICDGSVRTACAGFVANVQCRAPSCDATTGKATLVASCNGTGACPAAQFAECGAYACAGAACGVAPCASDADCAPKFRCDAAAHDCVPLDAATCDPDGFTLRNPDGSSESCEPYRCQGSACKTECTVSDDCTSGFVCNPGTSKCGKSSSAAAEEGGCGCRIGAERGRAGGATLALLAALLMARRRARRSGFPRPGLR